MYHFVSKHNSDHHVLFCHDLLLLVLFNTPSSPSMSRRTDVSLSTECAQHIP